MILNVKSTADFSRFALLAAIPLLSAGLSACGQTGPLYLPTKPALAATPAKSDASKPSDHAPAAVTQPSVPASK